MPLAARLKRAVLLIKGLLEILRHHDKKNCEGVLRNKTSVVVFVGGGGACPCFNYPPPRYGIRMRVHDRYRHAQSRSAKQKSKRKALQ